jgi:hypothetical protein
MPAIMRHADHRIAAPALRSSRHLEIDHEGRLGIGLVAHREEIQQLAHHPVEILHLHMIEIADGPEFEPHGGEEFPMSARFDAASGQPDRLTQHADLLRKQERPIEVGPQGRFDRPITHAEEFPAIAEG